MQLLLAAALAGAMISGAALAQSDWIRIAETDDTTWDVKPGSFEVGKTKGQAPIAVVVGRTTDNSSKRIRVYKWYVSLDDCNREMGKVVSLNVDGTYVFENDFVFGSGNIAAAMAQSICGAYTYQVKMRDKKSL